MMELNELLKNIADSLLEFDSEYPVERQYQPGIGPFTETKLVREIASRLSQRRIYSSTHRTPDMQVQNEWGIEFKLARPFGDNGRDAEHWSENLLHPYAGNVSLIGDCVKLMALEQFPKKCVIAIGYEHGQPEIDLDTLFAAFELISTSLLNIPLGPRTEERRTGLVHPVHQVVRCIAWELK